MLLCTVINSYMQDQFRVEAASLNLHVGGGSYCIVQLFELMDNFATPLTSEYDCLLVSLADLFWCVPSHSIIQSVSIMHECTTCTVKHVTLTSQVERLSVMSQKPMFLHDYNNNLFL